VISSWFLEDHLMEMTREYIENIIEESELLLVDIK